MTDPLRVLTAMCFKNSVLVSCDAASLSNRLSTFRRNIVPSSSVIQSRGIQSLLVKDHDCYCIIGMWAAYSKLTSKAIPEPLNHCVIFILLMCVQVGGWDGSVGKACCYGLCGPEFATPV